MPELTRQEVDPQEVPLGNSSLETFAKTLDSLKTGVDQGSEIALLIVEYIYKSDNPITNKILQKYRGNCNFRKSLRNATLDFIHNGGLIYSLRKDKKCLNTADKVFIATSLASLGVNSAKAVNEYRRAEAVG